jgi:uncharacterized membrane protein YoaK (UPF0700 family)
VSDRSPAGATGLGSMTSSPAVDSRAALALLVVLSVVAGSTDIIGFLGLNGLFTAHITGNLAVLAAHVVAGGEGPFSQLLAVPVFMVMVGLTGVLAGGLESIGVASLRPLLLLQFLLLAGFLSISIATDPRVDPNATKLIFAGMLGVSAMAVQNALVQISLKGAPPTAIMTTNVTRFAMDISKLLLGGNAIDVAQARNRAARTLPVILGFAVGCAIGAACEAAIGLRSLLLPAALALLALALGFAIKPVAARVRLPD